MKTKKFSIEYETDDVMDEIQMRLFGAIQAIWIYDRLRYECNHLVKNKAADDDMFEHKLNDKAVLRDIVFRYIIVQIHALIDNRSNYSLRIESRCDETKKRTKKFIVRKKVLRELFSRFNESQLTKMKEDIDLVLKKYRYEVGVIKKLRGDTVAHMNTREAIGILDWDREIINYHRIQIPKRIRARRLWFMCEELRDAITQCW